MNHNDHMILTGEEPHDTIVRDGQCIYMGLDTRVFDAACKYRNEMIKSVLDRAYTCSNYTTTPNAVYICYFTPIGVDGEYTVKMPVVVESAELADEYEQHGASILVVGFNLGKCSVRCEMSSCMENLVSEYLRSTNRLNG